MIIVTIGRAMVKSIAVDLPPDAGFDGQFMRGNSRQYT